MRYGKKLSTPVICPETGRDMGVLVLPETEFVAWVEDYGKYCKLQFNSLGEVRHVSDIWQYQLKGLWLYIRSGNTLQKGFYLPFNGRENTLVYYFHNQVTIGSNTPEHIRYLVFGKKAKRSEETVIYRLWQTGKLDLISEKEA